METGCHSVDNDEATQVITTSVDVCNNNSCFARCCSWCGEAN